MKLKEKKEQENVALDQSIYYLTDELNKSGSVSSSDSDESKSNKSRKKKKKKKKKKKEEELNELIPPT